MKKTPGANAAREETISAVQVIVPTTLCLDPKWDKRGHVKIWQVGWGGCGSGANTIWNSKFE